MGSRILVSLTLVFGLSQFAVKAQNPLERLRKGAEDALRNPEQRQPSQAVASQAPRAAANTPASSTKVETLALVPSEKGLEFYVSPHGGHLAAVTQKGSRFVVIHDGVAGPPFDEILDDGSKHRVYFSPDNSRYSYAARLGQEYVIMVDGKEVVRLPVPTTDWGGGRGGRLAPAFTANSKHTYFIVGADTTIYGVRGRLFFDGQPVAASAPLIRDLVFSPDGDHYAFSAATIANERQPVLVVDGKPAAYQGSKPQFTADGRHLFTQNQLPNGQDGVEVLLDGKPWIRGADVRLYVPPVGDGVVSVVRRRGVGGAADTQFLVIGGKRIETSVAAGIVGVHFSPDGKHYAAEGVSAAGSHFIVIDGKKGLNYQAILNVSPFVEGRAQVLFSLDSARSAYTAKSGDKSFVVVDGEESDGYPLVTQVMFSPNGKRVAFAASGLNGALFRLNGLFVMPRWVVVDGKPLKRDEQVFSDLAFSPDGSRYAHIAGNNAGPQLVVDGVATEGTTCCEFDAAPNGSKFGFSPDGKHIVHVGAVPQNQSARGLVIDGKLIPFAAGAAFRTYNPTFTPDGRHLLWFEQVNSASRMPEAFVISVDGRPAARVAFSDDNRNLMTKVPGAWEMGADGVLTVFAQVGDSIHRVRITPPDDTSIDTLIASAASARGR